MQVVERCEELCRGCVLSREVGGFGTLVGSCVGRGGAVPVVVLLGSASKRLT